MTTWAVRGPQRLAAAVGALALLASVACDLSKKPHCAPRGEAPAATRARDARLSGADLHADVLTLRTTYEALHPGLRRYNDDAQLAAAFAALDAEVRDGASLSEAFRAFSVFAAKIRCGHTFLNPTNQPEAIQHALFSGPHLPFYFRWIDGRMIVTRSLSAETGLAPGDEIAALDGTPASEVLARLLTVARADGSNDSKRVASLERLGTERFEPFDVAYPLFFRVNDAFALDILDARGGRRHVVVHGEVAPPATGPSPTSPPDDTNASLWSLRYLDAKTAYLAMPTWVTYNSKWDWKADLQKDFETLAAKQATTLIVDLRGNEGGTDVGDAILGHYVEAPLHTASLQRWTRYRRVPDPLRPNLHTWDRSFFDWGDAAKPRPDGFYVLTRYDDDPAGGDVLAPLSPRSRARLIVLVDGANSSATFQFAQLVQANHLGTLVGEPTGGNQRGINGGAFFFLALPRTGLEIDLPLIGRFPADGHPERLPDRGLMPDVLVKVTAADLAAGRDPELAAARALSVARGAPEHTP